MRRARFVPLLVFALSGCVSNEQRLDATWDRLQAEQDRALERAQALQGSIESAARQSGDDSKLVAFSQPPSSPIAHILLNSASASIAYLQGDLAALQRAEAVLKICVAELDLYEVRSISER